MKDTSSALENRIHSSNSFVSLKQTLTTAAVICLAIVTTEAASISVGSGLLGGTTTQHEYQTDYAAWFVADLTSDPITPAPLQIASSLTGGRWTQELTFGLGSPNLQTGDFFLLQELLTVGSGDFALQNWHQEIQSPNWQWADGSIFDNDTAEPLLGLQVNFTSSVIDFNFNVLTPGTDIFVVKFLEYIGPDDVAPTSLSVQAYTVVPEPSSLALMAIGLAGWAIRRSRTSSANSKIS